MALETPESIEALANSLTGAADVLHDRLIHAIKGGGLDQATALAIFQQESALRQKANALFADVAGCVVNGLAVEQAELIGAVGAAKARLQAVDDIRKAMELVADVIVLGASAAVGKPGPILAALKEIRNDLK